MTSKLTCAEVPIGCGRMFDSTALFEGSSDSADYYRATGKCPECWDEDNDFAADIHRTASAQLRRNGVDRALPDEIGEEVVDDGVRIQRRPIVACPSAAR